MLFLNTTLNGLQFGLCYAILAIGLYLSYTILDFADLSVDSIFPLGAIMGTIAMYNWGFPPILAVFVSFFFGMAAGSLTGFLHVKCHIDKLLCGIIVMTGLLSVNLALTMVLSGTGFTGVIFTFGKLNINGFFNGEFMNGWTSTQKALFNIGVLLLFVIAIKILVDLFLKTKTGFMLRATGNNEQMVVSMGKDPGTYKMIGMALADGLVGIAGCLYAQLMRQ